MELVKEENDRVVTLQSPKNFVCKFKTKIDLSVEQDAEAAAKRSLELYFDEFREKLKSHLAHIIQSLLSKSKCLCLGMSPEISSVDGNRIIIQHLGNELIVTFTAFHFQLNMGNRKEVISSSQTSEIMEEKLYKILLSFTKESISKYLSVTLSLPLNTTDYVPKNPLLKEAFLLSIPDHHRCFLALNRFDALITFKLLSVKITPKMEEKTIDLPNVSLQANDEQFSKLRSLILTNLLELGLDRCGFYYKFVDDEYHLVNAPIMFPIVSCTLSLAKESKYSIKMTLKNEMAITEIVDSPQKLACIIRSVSAQIMAKHVGHETSFGETRLFNSYNPSIHLSL